MNKILPEQCLVFLGDAIQPRNIGIVQRGRFGYQVYPVAGMDPEDAKAMVEAENAKDGIPPTIAEKMYQGAMFGWPAGVARGGREHG